MMSGGKSVVNHKVAHAVFKLNSGSPRQLENQIAGSNIKPTGFWGINPLPFIRTFQSGKGTYG